MAIHITLGRYTSDAVKGIRAGDARLQTPWHDNTVRGARITRTEPRHTHVEWLRFLKQIDRETPNGLELHLIADNYATHKHPKVKAWLAKRPRFNMHFTPTSSSWLNLVERFRLEPVPSLACSVNLQRSMSGTRRTARCCVAARRVSSQPRSVQTYQLTGAQVFG